MRTPGLGLALAGGAAAEAILSRFRSFDILEEKPVGACPAREE